MCSIYWLSVHSTSEPLVECCRVPVNISILDQCTGTIVSFVVEPDADRGVGASTDVQKFVPRDVDAGHWRIVLASLLNEQVDVVLAAEPIQDDAR